MRLNAVACNMLNPVLRQISLAIKTLEPFFQLYGTNSNKDQPAW